MNRKGFTLIELIIVIVILGILAIVAIPRFVDLRGQAEAAARDGVVASVLGGIHIYYAESQAIGRTPAFPATLEGVDANTYFEVVLDTAIPTGGNWTYDAGPPMIYTFTFGDGTTDEYTYDGNGGFTRTGGDHA